MSSGSKGSRPAHSRKSSQSGNNSLAPGKKPKSSAKDVLAEAGKHTNYAELALFDKVCIGSDPWRVFSTRKFSVTRFIICMGVQLS